MQPEGFQRATADIRLFSCPLVASAEAKSPAFGKEQLCLKDQQFGRAHLARQCASSEKSKLGALLRERKVTGRDASLPALLLAASLELVGRGTVGALPQTPQGALPLDPAKGSSTLWTPIRAIELVSSPCFARVFILLALRLSLFFLPV